MKGDASMTCPYCDGEMEKGYIKSSHAVHWGPGKELGFVNDDIVLAKPSMRGILEGLFVEAHCCKNCKKVVVSFD